MLAVTVTVVVGGLPAVGQVPFAPGAPADESPRHDPIEIVGDGDLLLPPPAGDDNGVRRGTGTEDDPFVIEDWTIEHPETEPAILVQSTSLHLVIQNVRFDGQVSSKRIALRNARNVTIRSLSIDSYNNTDATDFPPTLLSVDASENVTVRDLRVSGNIHFGFFENHDVRIKEIRHMGPKGHISLAGGTYRVEAVSFDYGFHERGGRAGGGLTNGKIWLGTSRQAPDGPCSLRAEDISILGAGGYGIQVGGSPCDATLRGVEITSTEVGVLAEEGAHIDLGDARLRYIHASRDPPTSGIRHGYAGLRADLDDGDAGSTIAARNVTVDGYWHGVSSRGGAFDLEDLRIQGHRIGVYASGSCEPCQIHNSSILGSKDMHVLNEGSSTVDARRNWWGSPDGPSEEMIEGDVLVEPWRTEGPTPPSRGQNLPGFGPVAAIVVLAGLAGVQRAFRKD